MKLAWGPEEERFRAELAGFLDEHLPPELVGGRDWATAGERRGENIIPDWARKWQATLFDHGWMVPGYPPQLGGRNATPVQTLVYMETLAERGILRSVHFPGYAIVAPSLLDFGTDEQKALAPSAIRGDTVWCIGMSEPNAGSDLASLTTRAVLDGDRFIINGQKVWTSYAMVAQKCFCYVRTTPITEVPKHKGISVLIVDMDTPGIDVRPLRHITGPSEFAEVFFTDVEVPATRLVGEVNDGWRITMGSLAHERGGLWVQGVATCDHTLRDLVALCQRRGLDQDPTVRRKLAAVHQQVQSLRALGYKGFSSFARPQRPGAETQQSASPEHSYLKLATSELGQSIFRLGMEVLGPYGAVVDAERGEQHGRFVNSYLQSFASTIAGGSSEIQRNIIAQRVLGLPRG